MARRRFHSDGYCRARSSGGRPRGQPSSSSGSNRNWKCRPGERLMTQGQRYKLKAQMIKRARNTCSGCGYQFSLDRNCHELAKENGGFELDHKVPIARGGTDSRSNLQILCLPCHDGKTNYNGQKGLKRNMTDGEWRKAGKPQDWIRKRELLKAGRKGK